MSTEGMQGSAAAPAAEPVPGPLQECMLVDSPAEVRLPFPCMFDGLLLWQLFWQRFDHFFQQLV